MRFERSHLKICVFSSSTRESAGIVSVAVFATASATSDVITDYINTQRGDEEVGIVAKEITDCLGRKVVGILIEDFGDKGEFLRDILEIAIITAETPELEENAKRLKRCVLPLLGRVFFSETNRLSPKEQRSKSQCTNSLKVPEILGNKRV